MNRPTRNRKLVQTMPPSWQQGKRMRSLEATDIPEATPVQEWVEAALQGHFIGCSAW